MEKRKSKNEKKPKRGLLYKSSSLGELYFCALYKINSIWKAGEISSSAANKIYESTGILVDKYKICLTSGSLRHFLSRHFDEKAPDQRGIHFDDLFEIENVINNFTSVEIGNTGLRLLFKKKYPNKELLYLVMEINKAKKILAGVSFWIKT